jgi:hypothetical protein
VWQTSERRHGSRGENGNLYCGAGGGRSQPEGPSA